AGGMAGLTNDLNVSEVGSVIRVMNESSGVPGCGGAAGITGATRWFSLSQPDPELGAQRPGDALRDELADGAVGDAPDHLAGEPAVRVRVIAVGRARFPKGRLSLERLDDRAPCKHVVQPERPVDRGKPRSMAEEPSNRDSFLAFRTELGPVLDHRGVEVKPALLGQHVRGDGSDPFGCRPDHLERVPVVRLRAGWRRDPSPEVDHLLAAHVNGARSPHLASLGEVRLERLAYGLETSLDAAVRRGLYHAATVLLAHRLATAGRFDASTQRPQHARSQHADLDGQHPHV